MKSNSIIYKNPQGQYLFDLSVLGVVTNESKTIEINQQNHYFQVGDILYYNVKTKMFAKAVAINSIESEACIGVLKVVDKDNFIAISNGEILTDRYNFNVNTILYLSDVYPGKVVSIGPQSIIKQIGVKTENGIMLNIQRGYHILNNSLDEELEFYTQDELDEIIKNIW